MDKVIWKLTGNSYFLDNILVGVRVTFLPDCSLILFLHKYKDVRVFLN